MKMTFQMVLEQLYHGSNAVDFLGDLLLWMELYMSLLGIYNHFWKELPFFVVTFKYALVHCQ